MKAPCSARFCWLLALSLALSARAGSVGAAELKLASFFGDHMVLQRERPVCVRGEGEPNTSVKVSVANREAATSVGPDGRWQVWLKPLSRRRPLLAWLFLPATAPSLSTMCSSAMYGFAPANPTCRCRSKQCDPAEQAATLATRPKLRLCSVAKSSNAKPQSSADINWRTLHAGIRAGFLGSRLLLRL